MTNTKDSLLQYTSNINIYPNTRKLYYPENDAIRSSRAHLTLSKKYELCRGCWKFQLGVLFVNKVQRLPSEDVSPMSLFIVALVPHSEVHSLCN